MNAYGKAKGQADEDYEYEYEYEYLTSLSNSGSGSLAPPTRARVLEGPSPSLFIHKQQCKEEGPDKNNETSESNSASKTRAIRTKTRKSVSTTRRPQKTPVATQEPNTFRNPGRLDQMSCVQFQVE